MSARRSGALLVSSLPQDCQSVTYPAGRGPISALAPVSRTATGVKAGTDVPGSKSTAWVRDFRGGADYGLTGERGRKAVERLMADAFEQGLIPRSVPVQFAG